uniref:Uncharacterized protein n=1 Tax=candidate division CPR3 bacterium TaxID=2268181 RepID=A0A7C4M3H9_UNCC3
MTSEKQIKANRENAQKGGIKSAEGKAIVRFNSLKHGLTSVILSDYDNGIDFDEISNKLIEELDPSNLIERMLVERIAINYLRMVRAIKIEKNLFNSSTNPYRITKKYKNEKAGEEFEEQYEIYEKRLKNWENDVYPLTPLALKDIPKPVEPIEPEHKWIIKGVNREFSENELEVIANTLNRYYVSAENRFYKALREFRGYKKQNKD